nr:hypothetical protein [Clostridium botulinum]
MNIKIKSAANDMYKKLSEPKFFYTESWNYIDGFVIDSNIAIVVIMLLLGVSPIFSEEYKTKVSTIILSVKKVEKSALEQRYYHLLYILYL